MLQVRILSGQGDIHPPRMPQTVVLPVNPTRPDEDVIARAAAVLRAGGLVAFPTETVYGLGANALDAAAVRRIFEAKGRPEKNPLIVHVADVTGARAVVAAWPLAADPIAERFWPGPLTVVLPRAAAVPDAVTAGGPTVAVRIPAHPVAQALIAAAGVPLAAPSANRSARLSPTRAEHVLRDLEGCIEIVLDGGPTPGGLESTVLNLTTTPPRLLRPGLVTPDEIEAVIGPIEMALPGSTPGETPLPSPGMLGRHYAPRAPLELANDDGWERVTEHCRAGGRVGWLSFAATAEQRHPLVMRVAMPAEAADYAARFYAVLHALDDAGVDRIVVDMPPDTQEWLAVRDRLRRAAAS
jgi:L-threonylcarbamoyladenylate synthase